MVAHWILRYGCCTTKIITSLQSILKLPYCTLFWDFILGFDVLKKIYLRYKYQKPSIYLYSSSFRSSAQKRSILACLINIHEPLFWLACCFMSDARPDQPQITSQGRRHNYVTALGGSKNAHSNQCKFSNTKSLKYLACCDVECQNRRNTASNVEIWSHTCCNCQTKKRRL